MCRFVDDPPNHLQGGVFVERSPNKKLTPNEMTHDSHCTSPFFEGRG